MTEQFRGTTQYEDTAVATLADGMSSLSDSDREALRHLRVVHRFVGRGRSLMNEGEAVTHVRVLCKGWAMRSQCLDADRRQIIDFALPGDIIGLHLDGMGASICDVTALTPCEVGEIDVASLDRIAFHNKGVAAGLHQYLSRQLMQASDQILRLGRMTAYERVCSFLLDIYRRQRHTARLEGRVDFPITQTVVADLLGLSVVHVNRQVMRLRRESLVTLDRRQLIIHDEPQLAKVARFRERGYAARPSVFMAAE
ncbi:MAG: Crp/Fnr family transcriptional regulator [Pseudomonadota bacterium]